MDVGKQEDLPVVDIWNALYNAAGRDEQALHRFLRDGLHLNAAGYEVGLLVYPCQLHSLTDALYILQILYKALINTIGEKYPEVHYENLQPVFTP